MEPRIRLGSGVGLCASARLRGLHAMPGVVRAVLLLLLAGAAFASGFTGGARTERTTRPAIEVDGASLSGEEIFGPGPEASNPSTERVTFLLPLVLADGGPYRIRLRYSIARAPEERIEIRLNERAVAFAAASLDGWLEGIEVSLPVEAVRAGDRIHIDFVDVLRGIAPDAGWNVGAPALVVEPTPACEPAECLEQAERLHALGQREYDGKSLGPGNLFGAWSHLDRAVDFLEALGGESAALARSTKLRDLARRELDERCASLRFTVMRGVALEDRARARKAAQEILRVFPGAAHPCNDSGRRMLALLD